MYKKDIRNQINDDINNFLMNGGEVKVLKTSKVKIKNVANGKQKAYYHSSKPASMITNFKLFF